MTIQPKDAVPLFLWSAITIVLCLIALQLQYQEPINYKFKKQSLENCLFKAKTQLDRDLCRFNDSLKK